MTSSGSSLVDTTATPASRNRSTSSTWRLGWQNATTSAAARSSTSLRGHAPDERRQPAGDGGLLVVDDRGRCAGRRRERSLSSVATWPPVTPQPTMPTSDTDVVERVTTAASTLRAEPPSCGGTPPRPRACAWPRRSPRRGGAPRGPVATTSRARLQASPRRPPSTASGDTPAASCSWVQSCGSPTRTTDDGQTYQSPMAVGASFRRGSGAPDPTMRSSPNRSHRSRSSGAGVRRWPTTGCATCSGALAPRGTPTAPTSATSHCARRGWPPGPSTSTACSPRCSRPGRSASSTVARCAGSPSRVPTSPRSRPSSSTPPATRMRGRRATPAPRPRPGR